MLTSQQDIAFDGGLVHIVDQVLQIPWDVNTTLSENTEQFSAFETLYKSGPYSNVLSSTLQNVSAQEDVT